jgi:uncharacterized short protein YbdD (DUF466 family)
MRSSRLKSTLAGFAARLLETANLMVGIPDYDRYVAHRRSRHPGEPVMSRSAFVQECTARRFGDGGAPRCC